MTADDSFIVERPFDSVDYLRRVELTPPPQGTDPVALFLVGGPLSGKSTVLAYLRSKGDALIPENAVYVDPYAVRGMLPEWNELVAAREPSAAAILFAETCHVAASIVARAVEQGLNLILDGIGDGPPGVFVEQLERFHKIGYGVRILLVDAPIDEALERNQDRARREGRLIPPELLRELHVECVRRHNEWRELPWIKEFQVYSGSSR